jgi:hypothetical protein
MFWSQALAKSRPGSLNYVCARDTVSPPRADRRPRRARCRTQESNRSACRRAIRNSSKILRQRDVRNRCASPSRAGGLRCAYSAYDKGVGASQKWRSARLRERAILVALLSASSNLGGELRLWPWRNLLFQAQECRKGARWPRLRVDAPAVVRRWRAAQAADLPAGARAAERARWARSRRDWIWPEAEWRLPGDRKRDLTFDGQSESA